MASKLSLTEIHDTIRELTQIESELERNINTTMWISDTHGAGERFTTILKGRFGLIWRTAQEALSKYFSNEKLDYLDKVGLGPRADAESVATALDDVSDGRRLLGLAAVAAGTLIGRRNVFCIILASFKKVVPDALRPATPFELAAHSKQPIWITLIIPRDTRPGVYSGKLVVKPANAAKQRIPIRLKVWNFTLPETPSHKTAFGISRNLLPRQHGVLKGSEAAEQLYARYYNFLLDRWISAYWLPPAVTAPEAERYIRDPRVTGFLIPYNDDVEEMRKSCLLYTSDAADDLLCVDLGGRRIIKKKNTPTHTTT